MRKLFALLVALPGTLAGQAGMSGRIAFEQFTLPNGLRVIFSPGHSTPIVTVDVWYEVGSRNERRGRSGFAHLFEHMMFEGSAHVKKSEHGQLVERAGGNYNGSTAEDRTNYWETVPSNRLNLALWLEADRMRSLAITEQNFENQRQAVKEERRGYAGPRDSQHHPRPGRELTLECVGRAAREGGRGRGCDPQPLRLTQRAGRARSLRHRESGRLRRAAG